MPIYEYGCSACGKTIDVLQKMSDPTPAACTACGAEGTLSKQLSRSSFHLKGGGWYSDLYGSTKKDGGGSSSSSSASSSPASSSTTSSSSTSTAPSAPAAAPSTPAASGDKS
ncbi:MULTISPECIES: FmdB family zinc ribbon protein [Corallococcus]|uniref:Zinc ribbon domain-containing protein n=1 Tax=Corallococcus exiguus TaxID=83462 RepID=A0A7X4Y815_9BACT|nr:MULTISPECIES: zinc ribbon domain-containing protein [Corallococcus]NBC40345.1 zinc ribbon domain-containing protein [Corallococcus exiguus]RKH25440.1 zinc ribbon domain-containing protein [Corallococcus sp. CA041A]TNV63952.1 zinc ribbon domain-containing protein [Corallococcus exiguus]